ncbi:MAG: homocysteine S-methyltransferase family protein [candidate division Zixibacteria bacterium]|nr:homocysteine S-methyltransferase family protein [candidate division Zixibacteria bacterium]
MGINRESILNLAKKRVVLFDGAMGSTLVSLGLPEGECPESWNLTHSEVISDIHQKYLEAGADVIQTNTFGASRLRLASFGYDNQVEKINARAVEIAKKVCPEEKYVAGDIGPCGGFLEPVGKFSVEELEKSFLEQAKALAWAKVDFFSIETMCDLREALVAIKAIKTVSDLPIFASMTFDKKPRGYFTMMGNTVSECATELKKAGADVIGANCTLGSAEMIGLIEKLRKSTDLPIIIQPNAGKPELIGGRLVYRQDSESFAEDIRKIAKAGANFVGGCCGTTHEFIRGIHKKLFG